jgi:hypothetical protein
MQQLASSTPNWLKLLILDKENVFIVLLLKHFS